MDTKKRDDGAASNPTNEASEAGAKRLKLSIKHLKRVRTGVTGGDSQMTSSWANQKQV